MYNYLFLTFFLLPHITLAQTEIKSSEIENTWGHYNDLNGNSMSGHYKIIYDDGHYDTIFLENGEIDGIFECFEYGKNMLAVREEYFKGIFISRNEYDKEGNITNEYKNFNLEVLKGKKESSGRIFDAKIKLTKLEHDDFSGTFHTTVLTLKDGAYDGDMLLCDENDRLIQQRIYDEGNLLMAILYTHQSTIFDTLQYRQDKMYAKDPRKRLDDMDYYLNSRKDEEGIIIWTGADGKPLDGDYIILDDDVVIYESSYINGKTNGIHKTYDEETGLLIEKFNMKNGQFDGVCTWYSEGHITRKNYRNIIPHGLQIEYDPDTGIITDSVNFVNGQKEGLEQKRWTGTAKEHAQYFYKNGKIHGEVKLYAHTSEGVEFLKEVENYVHGALNGKKIEYDSVGNILLEENYKFGKLDGPAQRIGYEGKTYLDEYRMGKIIKSKIFDTDGNLLEEWHNNDGKVITKTYGNSGNIKSINYSYDMEYLFNEGDTVITQHYNIKEELIEEQYDILSCELDLMDFAYSINLKYDRKGKVKQKLMTIEDYPNVVIRELDGENIIKEYAGNKYPDHGETHSVKYYNKKGEVIKTCTRTWHDENEYDDVKGKWLEEKCN